MEKKYNIHNVTVVITFLVLLIWISTEFLKMIKWRFSEDNNQLSREVEAAATLSETRSRRKIRRSKTRTTTKWAPVTIIICCILISIACVFYVAYRHEDVPLDYIFSTVLWILSTVLAVIYFKQDENNNSSSSRWPLVLKFWWTSFALLNTLTVAICLLKHFRRSARFPDYFPTAGVPDLVVFPLSSIIVSVNVYSMISSCRRNCTTTATGDELQHPLLTRSSDDNYASAGIWNKLTFLWLNQVFHKGRNEKLELSHIPPIPESETAAHSFYLLQESLRRKKTKSSSLAEAVIHSVWRPLASNGIFAGINTLSSYLGPLLITNFVDFLSEKSTDNNYHGYVIAFLFFFAKTVESLSQRQWYFGARRIGIRVRAALMASIFNKSISVKYSTTTTSKIIHFLDVDVERIGDFSWYFHSIWLLPVQVFLALLILYRNLGGPASIAALLVTVLVMVSNIPLANQQEKLHSNIMEGKDSRIKATAEILKCMRILKLHCWENIYLEKLLHLRDVERTWVKRYLYTCSAIAFLFWASPTFVSVVSFGVCFLTKTPLTPGAVLSALATFRILQDPIYNLPELVSMIAQTKVSIDRIDDYIKEESQQKTIVSSRRSNESSDIAVEIEPGEYAWACGDKTESNSRKPTIKIEHKIKIRRGEKVAICGSVGSGKSSFLCSIIGEIPRINGARIKLCGSSTTAYAPQSAWIQKGTIRENVLFGNKLMESLYEDVVVGCSLDKDVVVWVDGDMTVVGERGMNLSGGQKQRIQLARCIYSNSDVYLLDDPFSAVDAHTGGHLFKECLMGLLSTKTVVYVTHQMEFLSSSDLILVMKDGRIVQQGKYEDLIRDVDGELVRQMVAHEKSTKQVSPSGHHSLQPKNERQVHTTEVKEEPSSLNRRFFSEQQQPFEKSMTEDDAESGRVGWKVYSTFVRIAYKGTLLPVILLCQIIFQGLQMGSNYWISWGTEKEGRVSKEKLMIVFILLSIGSSVFVLGRAVFLTNVAIETAQKLFMDMTIHIFRAPISFFDFTPSSRILNRTSNDQSVVDTDIPYRLGGLVFALVQLLCIIILMSQVAWPVIFLFIIVLGISFSYQTYYISTARELARMVSVRKAPILHHFSESISGAATIRCFGQENRFIAKNHDLVDDYSRVTFYNYATMEWLSIRINFLFNVVFFIVLIILVTIPKSSIDPSLAGLATTYGLSLNVLQAWVIWNLCNVENKMISVERILQFSRLKSEAPQVIEECRPEPQWPTMGTIQLDDLHVRYGPELPMILRGVSCTFPGKHKIGIVGRTGSGKSTLIQVLFRVVEPTKGRILIDDTDICKIGLHDLRSRLSIIPQDPCLFQGTVRTNLDPLEEHSDLEIWEALHRCHLGEIVKKDQRLLDAPVAEDGENWSVGQRQLVCLARALLKKRRILVLDEATASVDSATDNMIQKTIREETGSCTVISVAHRIATIIDNDLVLVLEEGKVLEHDSPSRLLQDKTTAFSKLVTEFLRQSSNNHVLRSSS